LYVLSHLFLEAKKLQLISKDIDFYSGNSRLDLATDTFSGLSWLGLVNIAPTLSLNLKLRQQERLRKRCKETTTTSTAADELLPTTNHGKIE